MAHPPDTYLAMRYVSTWVNGVNQLKLRKGATKLSNSVALRNLYVVNFIIGEVKISKPDPKLLGV